MTKMIELPGREGKVQFAVTIPKDRLKGNKVALPVEGNPRICFVPAFMDTKAREVRR